MVNGHLRDSDRVDPWATTRAMPLATRIVLKSPSITSTVAMAAQGITLVQTASLTSLDEAYELAGIQGTRTTSTDLRAIINTFLGEPQDFEDVAMIPESSLSASLSTQAPPFSFRQVSRIYKFQEICILKPKSTPGTVLALLQVPPPQGTVAGFPPGTATPGYGKDGGQYLRIQIGRRRSNSGNIVADTVTPKPPGIQTRRRESNAVTFKSDCGPGQPSE
jgi:hypothetical protein